MIGEIFNGILAFIGLMVVLCTLIGIGINFLLYHNWYGETEAQRRERLRKERAARRQRDGSFVFAKDDRTGRADCTRYDGTRRS